MKFSLIMGTVGRTREVERFLRAAARQSYMKFELIVIDQNSDDRLAPLLAAYEQRVSILHLRSAPGLSRARNVGLQGITGDVVGFPDDDCWYAPSLLSLLSAWLEAHPDIDGVSVISRDEKDRASNLRWDGQGGPINRNNVWRRAISYTVFLRRRVATAVGGFDPNLGVGSGTRWESGEETDYLLRALNAGFHLYYEPSIAVFHPQPRLQRETARKRGYSYGQGFGRVQRKHLYPFPIVSYYWARSLAGTVLSLARLDPAQANLHWGNFKGRIRGWVG